MTEAPNTLNSPRKFCGACVYFDSDFGEFGVFSGSNKINVEN